MNVNTVQSQSLLNQITTIAGTGAQSFSGDGGQATSATMSGPTAVWGDTTGVSYISDFANNRIRSVSLTTGLITTFAGNGVSNSAGDGGVLTSAGIYYPRQFYGRSASSVFVVTENAGCRVRQLNTITNTIATTGVESSTGNGGPATSATLFSPSGVFIDTAQNIYISDTAGQQVRK